jgi:hypothetical protein
MITKEDAFRRFARTAEPAIEDHVDVDRMVSWLDDESDDDHYSDPEKYEEQRYSGLPGAESIRERKWHNYREAAEHVTDLSEVEDVAEFAMNTGVLMEDFGEHFPEVERTGLEFRREPAEFARDEGRIENVVQADVHTVPFQAGSFDLGFFPRGTHLEAIDSREAIGQMAVACDAVVLDFYREESVRDWMKDSLPMDSMVHSQDEIDYVLEPFDVEYRSSDQVFPFGLRRAVKSEWLDEKYETAQNYFSEKARDGEFLDTLGVGNTMEYAALDTSDIESYEDLDF